MSNVTTSIRHGLFASGTLPNASPVSQAMDDAPIPVTLTLTSSDAGRKIELSTDGGIVWFIPTYDNTFTTQLSVAVFAPITHCRFTGAAAGTDTWVIK